MNKFYTAQEVADKLKIKKTTVYELIKRGELSSSKIGKQLRVSEDQLSLYLDDVLVAVNGGRNPAYQEEDGQQVMNKAEILVRVVLGRGDASATVWTCDFSYDYVRINADYRS